MLETKGRVILISGANRGIGRAIAIKLQAQGYQLSLGVRDPAALRKAMPDWPGFTPEVIEAIHVARFDAANWASHAAWVEAAFARFGQIDGLINNAGISSKMSIRSANEPELDEIWAINCKGPLSMIRCALPHLEASGTGRIINIASLSGKRVRNDNVAYAMSKFALMGLTHSVRRLSWDAGVRVTAVCPSFVHTDMTADAVKVSPAEMIDPADLAELVANLIALPNTAAVAELLVNCRLEDMV